jgi:hypothetical protein
MTLLLIEGVELNPGPPAGQEKIDQILTHVRNQEECKVIKTLLESHNQKIAEMKKKRTNALGSKFEKFSEVINTVISDHKQINQ